MAGLIIIMIGLLLSTVDIRIITAAQYPEYQMVYDDLGLGQVIQKYVVNNMLGSSVKIDIASDVLAYILIAVGAGMLLKYSTRFLKVYIPLIITAGLYVFVKISPFLFVGKNLIVYALAASFIQLLAELFMEHRLIYTIANVTGKLPNERDTVLMKFGWVGSALCRAFLYFIVLVGLASWIIIIYEAAQLGFVVFCLIKMYNCRYYLEMDEISDN